MRDLSECKALIRQQIAEKENRRFDIRKQLISSFAICSVALLCICAMVVVPSILRNEKIVYIPNDGIRTYDSLKAIVNDSDLIIVGTVQSEHSILLDPATPESIKTEYCFVVDRCIVGDYAKNTINVITMGGVAGDVAYLLENTESYDVGDSYIVFLNYPNSDHSVIASYVGEFVETSPLMGKIHMNGSNIETTKTPWSKVDGLSSVKSVAELIQLIQSMRETN